MEVLVEIVQFVTDALGDASYLVVDHDVAAVVDPQRDVRDYLSEAANRGASIRYVFETHVHNDYVSGAAELAALGATIVAPLKGNYAFEHHPVDDGDEVQLASGSLRALATPGHTFEHTSFLLVDAGGAVTAAFTGGNILVAAAGRSDLLGAEHTEELTHHQYESARRTAALLATGAEILPTHGSGSFCSAGSSVSERRAPLADELQRNPLFSDSYAAFRAIHLAQSMPIPAYYRHMAPINRAGAPLFGIPPQPGLVPASHVSNVLAAGGWVIDARDRFDYAAAHHRGALSIEESTTFLAYTGWVTPFNSRLGLVTYNQRQAEQITTDLFRIGYEQVEAFVPVDHHAAIAEPESLAVIDALEILRLLKTRERPVVDVRFPYEHEATPIAGALQRPIDRIAEWVDEVGPLNPAVVCASGMRATIAASYIQRFGHRAFSFASGGADDVNQLLKLI